MVIPVSLFSDRSGEKPGDQGGPGAFVEPLGPGGVERRLERQVGRRVGKSSPPPRVGFCPAYTEGRKPSLNPAFQDWICQRCS